MTISRPHNVRAWAEVDLGAIRANIAALRACAHAEVLAVVKADAYGHGMAPVAHAALRAGAVWLGVATVGEGLTLRATTGAPILLLCPPAPNEVRTALAHDLTLTVGDEATLQAIAEAAAGRSVAVHLEVDTGIGRSGALPEQALALWQRAKSHNLCITGLTTHFSDADGTDLTLTHAQQRAFIAARRTLEQAGARFDWIHLSNSAATLGEYGVDADLIRPGLLIYGILPPNRAAASHPVLNLLQPALRLLAQVATVRRLPQGHPISYGATHRLERDSRVATVLIGYGDGYPRRLSNRGHLLLHSRRAPILGRVCMDQTVVDVTDIPDVEPGDTAVCLGVQGGERITVERLAALIDATEHEITTGLTPRLPRFYTDEAQG